MSAASEARDEHVAMAVSLIDVGDVSRPTITLAAWFTAISLGVSPLNFVLAGVIGYTFTPVLTAILLLVFPSLALLLLLFAFRPARLGFRVQTYVCFWMIVVISSLWLLNYAREAIFPLMDGYYGDLLTLFDLKRPYFFGIGFLSSALIGITASRDHDAFILRFLKAIFGLSAVVACLYLMTYDPGSKLNRLGGDAGLSIGILLSEGLAAGLALACIYQRVKWYWLLPVPIILAGILMSGTRAALVSTAVSFAVAFMLRPRRVLQFTKYLVPLITFIGVAVYVLGFVPDATIERITTFQLTGSQNRLALIELGLDGLIADPLGRTTGYNRLFPAGIEYAHNTVLQMLLECGVLVIVPFVAVAFLAFHGVIGARRSIPSSGFVIFSASVITHSLSSGDAYASPLWFCLFFLATIPGYAVRVRSNR